MIHAGDSAYGVGDCVVEVYVHQVSVAAEEALAV